MSTTSAINTSKFIDRKDAALVLSQRLTQYYNQHNAIVIGLPRGGVVTGYWIAKNLNLPLETVITRKIGCPRNREFAVGALSEDGYIHLNESLLDELNYTKKDLNPIIQSESREARRRINAYRNGRSLTDLKDKVVLLVDDGVATGSTCEVALKTIRRYEPEKVILITPVIPPDTLERLDTQFDEIIYESAPVNFMAVGQFYYNFNEVDDFQVTELLADSKEPLQTTSNQMNIGETKVH